MKVVVHSAIAALLVSSAAAEGAVDLTLDNFDDLRAGRNAFVKFLAPW